MSRSPNLFIVGAPKCGTTALWQYLGEHPDIYVAGKEYHYFGSDLAYRDHVRPSRETYVNYYAGAGDERWLLDASIGYLVSTEAATEIHEFDPASRIIATLRNPIDMMHSLHSELLFQSDEDVADFGDALALEGERRQGRHLPPGCQSIWALAYRHVARYTEQIQRYCDTFGRDQVHVVIFDDFRTDAPGTYRAMLEFLDIDPEFRPEFPVINSNKVARSQTVVKMLRTPPPVVRKVARMVIPGQAARRNLGVQLQSLNAGKKPRTPIAPALREELRIEFAPEVEALGALIGRDLSSWSQPRA